MGATEDAAVPPGASRRLEASFRNEF